jgi:tRNA pseudouridine13 synthase
MYIIKQLPEDFIVKEISNLKVKDSGKYSYYKLTKIKENILDVVSKLAKKLGIKTKDIGFAGSKDKNAVTEQVISIKNGKKEIVGLRFIGYADKPITLGDLKGNKFEIVVRNLDGEEIEKVDFVVNYFDEQRFSKNNVEIGKKLVKKKFENAAKLIDDKKCVESLKNNPNNFIGALQRVPLRMLKFYVHAYQSWLWNETVKKYLEEKCRIIKKVKYSQGEFVFVNSKKNVSIPLIGFSDENIKNIKNKEIEKIIKDIMEEEKVTYNDFIIKQIPEISMEGELRKVFVDVMDLKIDEFEEDELHLGKKKVIISFSLGKGSYATMLIRKLFQKE